MTGVETEAEPLVAVFVTVGVRTSDGPGPGPKRLPQREAQVLLNKRFAIGGSEPPRGYSDGGVVASGAIAAQ